MENIRFTDVRYGLTSEVEVCFSRYVHGGIAIRLVSLTHGPWLMVTMFIPGKVVPMNCVAIKNYAENQGIVDRLIENGVIEPEPITEYLTPSNVMVPIHRLTPKSECLAYAGTS